MDGPFAHAKKGAVRWDWLMEIYGSFFHMAYAPITPRKLLRL